MLNKQIKMHQPKRKKFNFFFTSGKLHKMPQTRNSLELICGNVAVTGDLTNPTPLKKKRKRIP